MALNSARVNPRAPALGSPPERRAMIGYARGMDVLQLDISGRPQAWITPREAAVLYACDAVAWTLGDTFQVLRGGVQRTTGRQSRIEVQPIVAVRGAIPSRAWRQTPALSNGQWQVTLPTTNDTVFFRLRR